MRDLMTLPDDLPAPEDDGACDHLAGMEMPHVSLPATAGGVVDVREVCAGRCALFFYPRTGRPEEPAPVEWDSVPGARGCTPQACGFRDRHSEFAALGVRVYGVSAQDTAYQREFVERTRTPIVFLSDERLELTGLLRLPTFDFEKMRLIKRLALYAERGRIEKAFYPVFPPDKNAETVLGWIRSRP